jgi:hypothetical protein
MPTNAPFHDCVSFPAGIVLPFNLISGTTASYTVTQQDRYIYVDATSQVVTVTLPPAASVPAGFTVGIKKKDSGGNAVTVARSGSDTFDGGTSISLAAQFNSCLLVSDGVSQWIRSSNAVATGGF